MSTLDLFADIGGRRYRVELGRAHSIGLDLSFDEDQPNFFAAPAATAEVFRSGDFFADTRAGACSNVKRLSLVPHCNGTHTECVGHISHQPIAITDVLRDALIPTTLISVSPSLGSKCRDSYHQPFEPDDLVITRDELEFQLRDCDPSFLRGLAVRTLPNDESKRHRDHDLEEPPYFTLEAMHLIRSLGVEHLLVDMPSIDRRLDGGGLSAHRQYWEVPMGEHDIDPRHASQRTITELIFVASAVPDGCYLLNLQIAPFVCDAAPSRPILFPVTPISSE